MKKAAIIPVLKRKPVILLATTNQYLSNVSKLFEFVIHGYVLRYLESKLVLIRTAPPNLSLPPPFC
jgi:hypothetical protein